MDTSSAVLFQGLLLIIREMNHITYLQPSLITYLLTYLPQEVGGWGMDWIELAQDRDRWWELETAAIYSHPNITEVNIYIFVYLSTKSR